MIPRSRPVKLLAAGLSLVAAGAAMAVGLAPEPVRIAGGAAPVEARLGTSFEDLSAGTLSGEAPSETVAPAPPAARAPEATPVEAAPSPAPPEIAPEMTPETAPGIVPETAPGIVPETAEPAAPDAPRVTVPDAPPEDAERAPPGQTVTGAPPAPGVVTRSRRPPERSARVERRAAEPDPRPDPAPAPAPAPKGNADRAARAGSETGRPEAAAPDAATGQGRAQASGNAAASNYPGAVMARLSRAPRPSVRARGAATVAFAVDGGGGLAQAAIAQSSGSTELDRAALRLVRRAAPFPAPPPGAQRSFSIRIAGR